MIKYKEKFTNSLKKKFNVKKIMTGVLIALASLSSVAQKGNGNPNDGGVIQPDPCEFATNVQLIGESSPEVGTVQTYTLQNADATERKIWKVQGAYQIDGQLASSINNEVTKQGNSIDVIWDGSTQNPNGKIIVRKELPCMAQYRRPEIIFPVHPVPGDKKKCGEYISTGGLYGDLADDISVCPFEIMEYYYAGSQCNYFDEGPSFHWGFKGAAEFSFDGINWSYGNLGWAGTDGGRTLYIKWLDTPDAVINCEPTGKVKCCGTWPFASANKVQSTITVHGGSYNNESATTIDNNSGSPIATHKTVIFDPYAGPLHLTMPNDPTADYHWFHLSNPINGEHSSGRNYYDDTPCTNCKEKIKIYTHYNDNYCDRLYEIWFESSDYDQCEEVWSIEGHEIKCSDPLGDITYTVNGGNKAGSFFWTIPPGWKSGANPIYTYSGFPIVKTLIGYLTNTKSITVTPDGTTGDITVHSSNYSGCLDNSMTSDASRHINYYNDVPMPEIHIPHCLNIEDINRTSYNYYVKNGNPQIQYEWQFFINKGENVEYYPDFTKIPPDPKIIKFGNESLLLDFPNELVGLNNFGVIVKPLTCANHQFYTNDASPQIWYNASGPNGFIPAACNNISAMVAPNSDISNENGLVNDNFVGVGSIEDEPTNLVFENKTVSQNSGTITAIYPNPANTEITINGNYNSFKVLDLQGKEMTIGTLNNKQAVVNTSNLPNGSYIIQLQGENTQFVRQIQVVH